MISRRLLNFQNKNLLNKCATTWVRNMSNTVETNGKVYEIRRYQIKPQYYSDFIKLTTSHFHLRTAYSPTLGYWGGDIGSINETIHVWEYDSFNHRKEVRAALAGDQEWLNTYVKYLVQYADKQVNYSAHLPSWCESLICKPDDTDASRVYELTMYNMKVGGPNRWQDDFMKMIKMNNGFGHSELVGVWYNDIGDKNNVSVIQRYKSLDSRSEGNKLASQDNKFTEIGNKIILNQGIL